MGRERLDRAIEDIGEQLHEVMESILPQPAGLIEDELFEAIRYSTLSKGKRLRPFLVVATSNIFDVPKERAFRVAAAIEFLHAYSLVHDDLPAIDNDDLRRGKLSCHKKFSEATAILTGDALLTLVFEVLSDEATHPDAAVRVELINKVALAAGYKGMVGGQMMDLVTEHKSLGFSEVVRMQRMKTGALFAVSCEVGAVLGRAPKHLRSALKAYAHNIGIAFQITDDLLDAEGLREEVGKGVGKDQERGKATLIPCIGIERAREHAQVLARQAVEYLSAFNGKASLLNDLAHFVVERNS